MTVPLVSIGMPVYNEERYVAAALDSLLAQDYPNLEVIVSDNGSTDDTEAICRRYAEHDQRVKYHRFTENRGVTENFRYVLKTASGEYFMWAAGHDLWSPNLVSECAALLDSRSDAVIAFGCSHWIDADGSPMDRFSGWSDTHGMEVVGRFFTVFWGNMHPILGLMRMAAVRRVRKIHGMAGSDLILLLEMILQGHFVHAAAAHWYRREFRGAETHVQRMQRYTSTAYGLSGFALDRVFPLLRLPVELVRLVISGAIPASRKLYILLVLLPAMPVKYLVSRRRDRM
jgi:glycosyltransferase involved in cell wall biosynthesis